jgi:hypothetical protein
MALFVGTNENDTISPATISAGVVIVPAGSDLSGDDAVASSGGDDVVEPDTGDDVAALGEGDDRFIWNLAMATTRSTARLAPTHWSSTVRAA